MVWLKCAIACFGWGVRPPNLPLPWGSGTHPHLTLYVNGPHKQTCQMASKSVKWFKRESQMQQTDDRQTTLCRNVSSLALQDAIPPKACGRLLSIFALKYGCDEKQLLSQGEKPRGKLVHRVNSEAILSADK